MSAVTDELAAILDDQRRALSALADRVAALESRCANLEATVYALRAITDPLIQDDPTGDPGSGAQS